jgi:tRNA G10  N-methylase Trm11
VSELNYIAILGRQPELGLVELESLLGPDSIMPFGRHALIGEKLDISKLGGVIKLAEIIHRGTWEGLNLPVDPLKIASSEAGKLQVAISVYGKQINPGLLRAMGMELKRTLQQTRSVRLVLPKTGTSVSAAEIKFNRVMENGFELVVLTNGREVVIGRTFAVQDIDWYSRRDYGRPSRDAKVGMMPPKLAQVLVNTTHSDMVWDPFCGTGQTMQEALLLGRETHGSDAEPKMVKAATQNLEWLGSQVQRPLPKWEVVLADAITLRLPDFVAVVSEGYLGPSLTQSPKDLELGKLQKQLRGLYVQVLANFSKQLAPGAEVTICVPAWRAGTKFLDTGLVDELPRLGYSLKGFQHVSNPLLYERRGQVVGRQILMLKKND